MIRIAITGSSGLIGSALRHSLAAGGAQILRLPHDPAQWNPFHLERYDAVIHLAGESLAEGRWTPDKKRRIRESRTKPTAALATLLANLTHKPPLFISASAIGIYGNRGDESLTERAEPGAGFLPETVRAWEAAADPARAAGIRVVHPRFGVVLSPDGGALKKMLPIFRACLGGQLGSGQQWMSWISLRDTVAALEFLMEHEDLTGPINFVSPQPVRNAEFTRALAAALHRPAILPAPAFALRAAFGEMADEALLSSTRVLPEILLAEDFRPHDPSLPGALAAMLR